MTRGSLRLLEATAGTEIAVTDGAVFVPAIMGAGVVFSLATLVRDLFERGTSASAERNADVRGRLAAAAVLGTDAPDLCHPLTARRTTVAVVGLAGLGFAGYVGIGATYNYFNPGAYLESIAWVWAFSMVVAVLSGTVGACALAAALRPRPPAWVWPVLVHTPLASAAGTRRNDRTRWAAIGALVLLTILSALVADPSKLLGIDEALTSLAQADWIRAGDVPASWVGATWMSMAVAALLVGLASLGCSRFALLFLAAAGVSLLASQGLRALIDRPRPPDGPYADASMAFPSGHIVQATLLAVLLPLAVYAFTRRTWARRTTGLLAAAIVAFTGMNRVAVGVHWPTDIIAGVLLGLAVGLWVRADLLDPDQHRICRRCAFQQRSPTGVRDNEGASR